MADLKSTLRQYIIDNFLFGDTETKFADGDSFMDSGIVDSTGILDIITFLEGEFSIKVNDDEIVPDNLDSLNNLDAFINRKKAQLN
jgi:acyl carrier protein